MHRKFAVWILMCKLLKTKGFSRETEAFYLIGGGENRTLVLSKRHSNHYMLSALLVKPDPVQNTTLNPAHFLKSRTKAKKTRTP